MAISLPSILRKLKMGRKLSFSIYALFILLSISHKTCLGAKLGSRSLEYGGAIPHNHLSRPTYGYNYPSSDENQTEPKFDSLHQMRINDRYAQEGVIHGKTFMLTVYQWNNHLGRPAKIEWTDDEFSHNACKEIPIKSRGKVRSVNTHDNCVVIYSRENCRGSFRVIKVGSPSHNRLSDLCFHKKPTSARPCTEDEIVGSSNKNHI